MRCLASSATAILTPASAYFMVRRLNNSMRDAGTGGAACGVKTCGSVGGREVKEHDKGHTVGERKLLLCDRKNFLQGLKPSCLGGSTSGLKPRPPEEKAPASESGRYNTKSLKHMEQPAPADGAGMNQGVAVG